MKISCSSRRRTFSCWSLTSSSSVPGQYQDPVNEVSPRPAISPPTCRDSYRVSRVPAGRRGDRPKAFQIRRASSSKSLFKQCCIPMQHLRSALPPFPFSMRMRLTRSDHFSFKHISVRRGMSQEAFDSLLWLDRGIILRIRFY